VLDIRKYKDKASEKKDEVDNTYYFLLQLQPAWLRQHNEKKIEIINNYSYCRRCAVLSVSGDETIYFQYDGDNRTMSTYKYK